MAQPVQKATFAAGCFWQVQAALSRLPGVLSTRAGYTGGTLPNPSYEAACTGDTGHAEAVEITFGALRISYEELLSVFFESHDSTTLNRQGPDIGTQYRSAIFCHDSRQAALPEEARAMLQRSGRFSSAIVTGIAMAGNFYQAEDYHQHFVERRGRKA